MCNKLIHYTHTSYILLPVASSLYTYTTWWWHTAVR